MMAYISKTQTGTYYSEEEGVEYNEYLPPAKWVKVMKKRWAEELRLKGTIRFGNLEEYRNWENPILGDKNDGQGMYVMNGDEYHTDSMSEIYAWCASLPGISHRRILDIAKSNNYDCVVEIKCALKFIERISKSLHSKDRGNSTPHLHCGKVQYNRGDQASMKTLNNQKFNFNVFQKSKTFCKDKEYRLSLTRVPIISCTRTDPLELPHKECIFLDIGNCSDIITIKKLSSTRRWRCLP